MEQEFLTSHSCYRSVTGGLFRFGRFMNTPMAIILNLFLIGITSLQYRLLTSSTKNRAVVAQTLLQYQQNKEQFPNKYSADQLKQFDEMNSGMLKLFKMEGKDLHAEMDTAEFMQYIILFAFMAELLMIAGFNYGLYRNSRFFKEAQLTPPVALPTWCEQRQQELIVASRPS